MKVSIITINYNSSQFTIKLIESILSKINSHTDYEIIVIDNASNKNDYNILTSSLLLKDPRIKLYRNNINNGFSGFNGEKNFQLLKEQFDENCGSIFAKINKVPLKIKQTNKPR